MDGRQLAVSFSLLRENSLYWNYYIDSYLKHMHVEEADVLPAARAHFSEADWDELDAAFAANRDPLTGHEASDEYRPLFQKILMSAPAPIGLG